MTKAASPLSSNWENLPKDVLNTVLDKLFFSTEYIRCGSVCKSWRTVAAENSERIRRTRNLHQIPLLMMPTDEYPRRSLCTITTDMNFCSIVADLRLPVASQDDIICGYSRGWLAIQSLDNKITLFNPARNTTIRISASFHNRPMHPIRKVIVSPRDHGCSPIDETNYVVVIIYGWSDFVLSVIRSGDEQWINFCVEYHRMIEDIIFHRGHLYYLSKRNRVYSMDMVIGTCPQQGVACTWLKSPKVLPINDVAARYIAESSDGDLLLFMEDFSSHHPMNQGIQGFRVFKLQQNPNGGGEAEWIEMKSLNEEVAFLGGFNESTCVRGPNWMSNSIFCINKGYSTIDFDGYYHMRGFNLADGSFTTVHHDYPDSDGCTTDFQKCYRPFWILFDIPKFQF